MPRLLHAEKSYQIRGIIFDVRKRLKTGWSEEVYHQALVQTLQKNNIPVLSKPRRPISHRGIEVHMFEPDIIVWDKLVLELKVLPFNKNFAGAHYAQIIHYLKFLQMRIGFLVNFGLTRVAIERVLYQEKPLEIYENYSEIQGKLSEGDRINLQRVRQIILYIGQQYSLGFPESIYRRIISIELNHNNIVCTENAQVVAKWENRMLANCTTNHLLANERFLLNIRSMLKHPPLYDFARMKTYLANSGLQVGLIINFGQNALQIFGINAN